MLKLASFRAGVPAIGRRVSMNGLPYKARLCQEGTALVLELRLDHESPLDCKRQYSVDMFTSTNDRLVYVSRLGFPAAK